MFVTFYNFINYKQTSSMKAMDCFYFSLSHCCSMILRQCSVLKNSSSPLGGGFFAPKNVLKVVRFCWKFALWVIWWCWIHFWCYFDPKKLLWSPYIKCESLCKQSQKTMKECSHGLGTKATPGNVDMGNSTVPISSLGNVRKCEKMWDPYVNKPQNQWKAHRVDSRRSLPLVNVTKFTFFSLFGL